MSTQAPQVLSRRANGVLPAPAGDSGRVSMKYRAWGSLIADSLKRKGSGEGTTHHRSGRGRGSHEKSGEAAKV